MKLFKKSTMSLALTAAMVGGVALTQQASALPTSVPAAAGDPYVNPNGLGQALIFPYYSVRNGLKSFFNITNTSSDTLAVKVRFREGHNSRDALDFNLVLSPQDVWAGWIEDGATEDDAPVVKTVDSSCVAGAPKIRGAGQALSNVAYADIVDGFADQGDNGISRTKEGYVEVVVMGKANAGSTVAANALHVQKANGNYEPVDCEAVNEAFVATAPTTNPVTFVPGAADNFADAGGNGDGDAAAIAEFVSLQPGENPLKGNFSIIHTGGGVAAGNAAVAIADFMDPAAIAANGDTSLVTAQNFPYFLEPTLASRDGIWSTSGLADVEAAITSDGIINEWAQNAKTGAATDWIITFPTKGHHVDNEDKDGNVTATNIQAAVNQWRVGSVALPGSGVFEPNIDENGAEVEIAVIGYDREEQGVQATTGNTTPSPYPPGTPTRLVLQGESNLISFGPQGTPSALFGKNFVLNFDVPSTLGHNAPNGWADLDFVATAAGQNTNLPAVGYTFKKRDQGNPSLSFGQIIGHAWDR